jgi:hypothetical protein
VISYPFKAIRQGRGNDWALFDISKDRTETTDLAAEQPDRVQNMQAAWEAWFERSMQEEPAPPSPDEQVVFQ